MIKQSSTTTHTRLFTCAHCGHKIGLDDLVLLREHCALPEEPMHRVHASCADTFKEDHPGDWDHIPIWSRTAAWLL